MPDITGKHFLVCVFSTDVLLHMMKQEQEQERSPGYILPTPLQFIYTTRS